VTQNQTATAIFIIRTRDVVSGRKVWWIYNSRYVLKSPPGRSRVTCLQRFKEKFGPFDLVKITQFRGCMRPSEAAMTIAAYQMDSNPKPELEERKC